jgi:MYXO-CTERM domain-containing protein
MRKSLWIILVGLPCLMLPGSLRADSTYTYSGQNYNYCEGCSGGPYALTITFNVVAGTQLDNLVAGTVVGGDLTADVSTFSFTDGAGLSITQANDAGGFGIDVSTDGAGNITEWDVYAQGFASTYGASCYIVGNPCQPNYAAQDGSYIANPILASCLVGNTVSYCEALLDYPSSYSVEAGNVNLPGTWTDTVTGTPEPSTDGLLLTGLLGLLALAARSKRHTSLTSC